MSDPTISRPPVGAPTVPYATPSDFAAPETDPNARTWGMIAHLSAIAGFVIPFGNIIGPLIVYLIKKDQMPFVAEQAKEALNFNITVFLAVIVAAILTIVLIGIILLPVIAIGALILMIIAAVRANEGVHYRYPLTIRFAK